MMNGYLKNYFQRIKNTRKFAREKNTHWIFPVFDALVISVLFSWELSVGSWILLDRISQADVMQESFVKFLWESSTYLFLAYFAILCLTVLDRMIVIFIHIHAFSCIFMHIHAYSCIFTHIHAYSCIFMHIHAYACENHA